MDGMSVVYNRANYEELLRAERLISEQIGELEKASACGLECAGFRDAVEQVMARISLIKQHYFTPPPTR